MAHNNVSARLSPSASSSSSFRCVRSIITRIFPSTITFPDECLCGSTQQRLQPPMSNVSVTYIITAALLPWWNRSMHTPCHTGRILSLLLIIWFLVLLPPHWILSVHAMSFLRHNIYQVRVQSSVLPTSSLSFSSPYYHFSTTFHWLSAPPIF